MRGILFVIGLARSGTTALVNLLNSHPHICIGMERYKYLNIHGMDGSDFSKERFFNFSETETNVLPSQSGRWKQLYENLESKYDEAKAVGDKIGMKEGMFDHIGHIYPGARFIYIIRHINRVASSWNARALDERDAWPKGNDYKKAVKEWNRFNGKALDAVSSTSPFYVVDYDKFYSGEASLDCLLSFAGVSRNPDFVEGYEKACAHYRGSVADKTPCELPGQHEFIAAHADFKAYEKLVEAAM